MELEKRKYPIFLKWIYEKKEISVAYIKNNKYYLEITLFRDKLG